ncbi:tetratricopeptide repeat protein [Bdellovibrio sp. HCB2-146]|uniref:tetratricopeptide repeat protein n=1 Tax=Bdellovibrio sp. HCB2-146 TaxID=3394362 RepID=UPI0039BD1BF4
MLENQIVQKSSENLGPSFESEVTTDTAGKIYLDAQEAIRDFEADTQQVVKKQKGVSPKVASFLANARVLMKHHDYNLALNLLRTASNSDSKNPTTLKMLAECLERVGRDSESLIVRKALATYDYGFQSLYGYATSLYKTGQDQEALDKYYEALSVLSEEDELLFETYKNMGNIFVKQGDFDAAEEYYNKAYTVNSQSDVLLVNFGTLEVQRNDFDKSLYCFRKAVEINSNNDKAWVGLAMVHNHFGDGELAWANLESALDINPKNRTAIHLAANWAVRDGRLQRAIDSIQAYLAEVEQDEEISLVLINLYCMASQIDNALLEMERVLLWNPDNADVRNLKKKLSSTHM